MKRIKNMRDNTDLLFRMPADSCEWRANRICFILIVLVTGRYCSLFALFVPTCLPLALER